jgi:hypothetical protein
MKMCVLLAGLLLTGAVQAQRVKVSWGEESKKELTYGSLVKGSGTEMVKLCFEAQRGSGLFSRGTMVPILSRYDARLQEQGMRSYTADEDNVRFDNLLSVRGNLFMFTNRYDRKEKSTTFYAQKIDSKTLAPVGVAVNIGELAALARTKQSSADYELSKDSTKILMFGLSPYSKKNNEKYYMAVYDNNLKKQWDNTVELPYLDKFVDVLDYVVTNDGSVGVIIKHYDKEVKRERIRQDGANVPAYKAKFLLYAKGEAKPREYILDLGDKYVHELQLTADNSSNLTLFGLYKNKYDGYVNGYFITSLSRASDKIEVKKMEPFPETLVDLVKKDKQGSNKEKDPGLSSYFSLADVMERADGSIDYLLEYYKMVMVTVTSRSGSYSYPVYTYGDIVDVHVNGAAPAHFVRLPKWQETSNTNLYSSFKAVTVNNKLVLFYNDDRDNVDRDIEKRPDDMLKFTKSILAMGVIDAKDNLTRSMVYDHKEMKLTTCVRVSQKLGTDKIGLYAQRAGGLFSSSKDMVGIIEVK